MSIEHSNTARTRPRGGTPNGAQSSRSTQKVGRGTPYKHQKVKIIYNGVLKSTNDNAHSIIDPLQKRKIRLHEDDPVRSKHVEDIF
jgi:hypothetical protein